MSSGSSRWVSLALSVWFFAACNGQSVVSGPRADAQPPEDATDATVTPMDAPDDGALPDVADTSVDKPAPMDAADAMTDAMTDVTAERPAGSCRDNTDCAANEFGFRVCDMSTGRCVQCTTGNREACTMTQYCTAANRCETG